MWRQNVIFYEILERELCQFVNVVEYAKDMGEVFRILEKVVKQRVKLLDKRDGK